MNTSRTIVVLSLFSSMVACGGAAEAPNATDNTPEAEAAAAASGATAPSSTRGESGGGEFMGQQTEAWIAQVSAGEDAAKRTTAVVALASIGSQEAGVTHALIGALGDEDTLVKTGANRTLIGFGEPVAAELLVTLTSSDDPALRAGVAPILGNWSANADISAALCAALTGDDDATVRAAAARGLTVGGRDSVAAVPCLIEALGDASPEVQQFSALALGRIGAAATAAIEALEVAAQSETRMVASAARSALRQIRQ